VAATASDREQRLGLRTDEIACVFIRPLGSVLPIGFLVFGTGALLTATYSLGRLPVSKGRQVFELLLVFVVPLQAVAAVFAFLSRDTAGGTAMGIFAGTWGALAVGSSLPPGETSSAVGTFLLADGVVIVVLAIASLAGNPALAVVLGVSFARFATNGIYELTGSTGFERAAGWIGLALSVAAAYAGLALLLEDARHRSVLPFLRQGKARQALDAELPKHLGRLEREPGVRTRL
jgi:hypothetical protein